MQSKSLEHTNEIQVDFSGSKIKPKEAKLKEKIVILKATNKAITYRREIDMHTVINKKPGDENESEENIKSVIENIVVSEQPCISNVYEKEQQLAQSDKLKVKTMNKLQTEKTSFRKKEKLIWRREIKTQP